MLSLIPRFEKAASTPGTITFPSPDGEADDTLSWAQLHDEAKSMAAAMQARGVRAGDHVALLGPTSRRLVTGIQATMLCGAAVVMLPLPMRMGSLDQFVAQTRARVLAADTRLLVVDAQLAEFLTAEPGDPEMALLDELLPDVGALPVTAYERPLEDPDALAILQFTSGSTSEPKGVMLPHRHVCSNLDGFSHQGDLADDDVVVSWLPLYHDMGLIGLLLLAMTTGTTMVQAAPQDFLSKPSRWMEWISRYHGSVTAGPNFSYALVTRSLRRAEGLDLSRMRVALNGAEPIDVESYREFVTEAGRHGFPAGAAFPGYGMAEVCVAGTFSHPGDGIRTDVIDREVLEAERYAAPVLPGSTNARELVKLGTPIPGLRMRTVDPDTGRALRDREVGELQIQGTSVMPGYYRRPDATEEAFDGQWLRSGDLAYFVDGELVVCGRLKDLVIIGGRNIYPQDIEAAATGVEGVRPGNVIAFGVEGRQSKQHIVVVAELRDGADEADVRRGVVDAVTAEIGVPPRDVVLVAPGSIPKTSSGKLQRSLCKRQHLNGELTGASADQRPDA